MGFKTDREFLRNISIGAVGTKQVASLLTAGGFRIIELERYCSCNKIWATKIKRLRVPDLLCLKTGIRIECRAKSTLKLTMSHAVKNVERAWDKGLRDEDLIAFIHCTPEHDGWSAADRVNLFAVGQLRATAHLAGLGRMKAASEGSEIQLTWPSTVPATAGNVVAVSEDRIETVLSGGRRQSYRLQRKDVRLSPHVAAGESFDAGDTMIASVVPLRVRRVAPARVQYDFVADLDNTSSETVYAAVKALGFLPELGEGAVRKLNAIAVGEADVRIRLEAAASLARLEEDVGWQYLADIALNAESLPEHRMEAVLILGELPVARSAALLREIAENTGNSSESRAAAVWGLAAMPADQAINVFQYVSDDDELTAVHAIVAGSRVITNENLAAVLNDVGEDPRRSAGLIRAVLRSSCDAVPMVIEKLKTATGDRRSWLVYFLASIGRAKCIDHLRKSAPELLSQLEFFWTYQTENWTNRLDVADQIVFLAQQNLR